MNALILATLAAASMLAAATTAHAQLPAPVTEALARAGVPTSAVGAVILPVEGGKPLLEHNAAKSLNPASTIKVITTFAALELLGPAFTYRTNIYLTAKGDLVIRGGGDPAFTYEKMWQLAHALRSRGVNEIKGDVILDRSYFAPLAHDPSKFDGESLRAYNVGPDALLVNFKSINFRFAHADGHVRVFADPDLPNVEVASAVRLVNEPCGSWRRGLKYDVTENGLLATVTFTGTYPSGCTENVFPLSVFDHARYAESVFKWTWHEAGGRLAGKVRAGTAPPDATLFYVHESEPLASLVRVINKHSNNVMTRQVFLSLSAEKMGVPGDAAASTKLVADWLRGKGIAAPELVFENGSGLSRVERASAGTLAAVLRAAWASPVMSELMSSFPIYSVDGTFKSRTSTFAGYAHFKGGTLTGVQAVAGYVLDAKGRRWVVVMIANHENANRAQPAMDALAEWVHQAK